MVKLSDFKAKEKLLRPPAEDQVMSEDKRAVLTSGFLKEHKGRWKGGQHLQSIETAGRQLSISGNLKLRLVVTQRPILDQSEEESWGLAGDQLLSIKLTIIDY